MDGKSRILIVSFLGHIQVASKKKHRLGFVGLGLSGFAFNDVPFTAPGHLVFFIKITGNARH
jgi:hypothetical protein